MKLSARRNFSYTAPQLAMVNGDGAAVGVDEEEDKAQLGSGSSHSYSIHCVPKPFLSTASIAKPMSMPLLSPHKICSRVMHVARRAHSKMRTQPAVPPAHFFSVFLASAAHVSAHRIALSGIQRISSLQKKNRKQSRALSLGVRTSSLFSAHDSRRVLLHLCELRARQLRSLVHRTTPALLRHNIHSFRFSACRQRQIHGGGGWGSR
jgi:hypothetical protein